MKNYIFKKILTGCLSVVISFVVTFFLVKSAPGNPVRLLCGMENPNPELVAHLTEKYGLDQPLLTQFGLYVNNILHGDLGYSYVSDKPVWDIIRARILPTLLLSTGAVLLSMLIGVALATYSVSRRRRWQTHVLDTVSYVLDSIPAFWLGLILMLVFASWLKILPTSGMYDVRMQYTGVRYILDVARHMILPLLTLVMIQAPSYYKIFRTAALKNLSEDFVFSMRATGISERKLFTQFVLKNSILPVITIAGTSIAFSISGVALTEIVFSWQGMGRLIMDAIARRDYPVLLGSYLIISICVCVFTILTDILYALADPQIKFR